ITPLATKRVVAIVGEEVLTPAGDRAVIVGVSDECCTVRTEAGALAAMEWGDVLLSNVGPSMSYLSESPEASAAAREHYAKLEEEEEAARPGEVWLAKDSETGRRVGILVSERGYPERL